MPRRRWNVERAFPRYTYIPKQTPHPIRDPEGHSYAEPHAPAVWQPKAWSTNSDYLFAVDLFNHGYYWEAHESWEGLWMQTQRGQADEQLLKGLIKFAAAGVKSLEGNDVGVQRHLRRAIELVDSAKSLDRRPMMGFDLDRLSADMTKLQKAGRVPTQPIGSTVTVGYQLDLTGLVEGDPARRQS